MNWYKIAQGYTILDYPYSLLETVKMQGENGLSLKTMHRDELKEAKKLEISGFINRVVKQDKEGKYLAYIINKEKFDQMGWKTAGNIA